MAGQPLSIEQNGRTVRLELTDDTSIVVGCAPRCDVVAAGPDVGDEHARLSLEDGVVCVRAIAEERPLQVNGETVTRATLATGDELRIGDVTIAAATVRTAATSAGARLRGLEGYLDTVADAVDAAVSAAPLRTEDGRRRFVLDDPSADLDELPELSREARALRRVLEITKRLSRSAGEDACRETVLDAALAVVGGDHAFFVAMNGDGLTVRASRDAGGDAVARAEIRSSDDEVEAVLDGGRAALLGDVDGPDGVVGVCASLGGEFAEALLVECVRERDVHGVVERELLRAIAEQAAIALGAVRLRRELACREADLVEAGARAERLNRRLADLLQRRTLELRETRAELARIDAAEGFSTRYTEIIGRGEKMLALLRQVDRVARTTVPVLFEGESGTGKELMARALHGSSDRSGERFVAENCAALPDSLLENELFGHVRGAFTGAETDAMGLFERADGGTLFLDEVGDMSPSLQTRLLRVLQEGEVRRVGADSVTKVDVRVVTATNRNLLEMVREGSFREDLYYRLAVVKMRVPALRERREDVPALVAHFLRLFSETGLPLQATDDALDALFRHDWPGNIRELQNEIRRAGALSRGIIDLDILSDEVRVSRPGVPEIIQDPMAHLEGRDLRSLVEELEVQVVRAVLDREGWNITRAARALGLSRLGLRKKVQRYGLSRPENRQAAASP